MAQISIPFVCIEDDHYLSDNSCDLCLNTMPLSEYESPWNNPKRRV
jgi:hypothetical protein